MRLTLAGSWKIFVDAAGLERDAFVHALTKTRLLALGKAIVPRETAVRVREEILEEPDARAPSAVVDKTT